jgi:hypothetical protein
MSVAGVLRRGRAAAERLMVDTVTIERVVGRSTDPTSGAVTPDTLVVYEGRGRVQTYEAFEAKPEAAEHQFTSQRYQAHIPVGAAAPRVGDIVTITDAAFDPGLTGARFRVGALLHKSTATAQRMFVDILEA